MINPWLQIPQMPPFCLFQDTEKINTFNHGISNEYKFVLNSLPIPYIGNPKSKVYILQLNPGHDELDLDVQSTEPYIKLWKQNINHSGGFYYIDKSIMDCPGYKYWLPRLRYLIRDCGYDNVYNNLFLIQYIGYHSISFNDSIGRLESQNYAKHLIELAMQEDKIIIAMRSINKWIKLVPNLDTYKNLFKCTNPRNPHINPKQLDLNYNKIVCSVNNG